MAGDRDVVSNEEVCDLAVPLQALQQSDDSSLRRNVQRDTGSSSTISRGSVAIALPGLPAGVAQRRALADGDRRTAGPTRHRRATPRRGLAACFRANRDGRGVDLRRYGQQTGPGSASPPSSGTPSVPRCETHAERRARRQTRRTRRRECCRTRAEPSGRSPFPSSSCPTPNPRRARASRPAI